MRLILWAARAARIGLPVRRPEPQRSLAEAAEQVRRGIADAATSRRGLALEAAALRCALAKLQTPAAVVAPEADEAVDMSGVAVVSRAEIETQLASISAHDRILAEQEDQLILLFARLRSQLDELRRLRESALLGRS